MTDSVRFGPEAADGRTTGSAGPAGASWGNMTAGTPAAWAWRNRSGRAPLLLLLVLIGVCLVAYPVVACSQGGAGLSDSISEAQWRNRSEANETSQPWPALRVNAPSNLLIGTAVDVAALSSDRTYRSVLGADFNAVTAENAMKWGNLESAPGVYDWTAGDRLVEFAQEHHQAVYGHALVWHSANPSWLSESWSTDQLRELLRKHVTTVASRYRGKVWAWDVVNEALAEDGSLRDTLWLRKLGPGYIADAFRWAHEADPDARLFLNDYGIEGRTKKADGLYKLVRELRKAGVPIHGVGFQSHLRWNESPRDMTGNLQRFAALGVSVAITELDVRIASPADENKLERQALLYQHVLKACLAVQACISFTVWGFTDARSWISDHYQGYGAACLFDNRIRPKPAHAALVDVLREHDRA